MILTDLLGATGAGVITGLIGNVFTAFTNIKMQKIKNERDAQKDQHEISMLSAETKAMIAEADANIKINEAKIQGELELLDGEIYKTSIKEGNKRDLSNKTIDYLLSKAWLMPFGVILVMLLGLVDFLKSFMRPGLTAYLVALTSWITYKAMEIITAHQTLLSTEQAMALFMNVVNIIIYLTVSCVTWWFGDRRVAKFLYRLNDGNVREK